MKLSYRIVELCGSCCYWPSSCKECAPILSKDKKFVIGCFEYKPMFSLPPYIITIPSDDYNGLASSKSSSKEEHNIMIKTGGKEFRICDDKGELLIIKASHSKDDNIAIQFLSNEKIIIK
ncbi:MAG: hypothetical protein RRY36_08170 [Bacteroidaceae bacterium]